MPQTKQLIKQLPWSDVGVLISIPTILATLHFLTPDSIYTGLWFYYNDPSVVSAWTSAYTHGGNRHLLYNLVSYTLTVGIAYWLLTVFVDARRVFWITFVFLLVLTPFITTAIDYGLLYQYYELFPSDADSKGFSGIIGGLAGMTLGGIGVYIARRYGVWPGIHSVIGVGLAAVGFLSVLHGTISALTGLLLIFGLVVIGAMYISFDEIRSWSQIRKTGEEYNDPIVVILGFGMIVCAFVYALIPIDVIQSGSFVNIFAHGTGFVFGTLLTGIVAVIE